MEHAHSRVFPVWQFYLSCDATFISHCNNNRQIVHRSRCPVDTIQVDLSQSDLAFALAMDVKLQGATLGSVLRLA